MIDLLKKLCLADGVSGNETTVAQIIIDEIKDYAEVKTDALGNIIAFKKGKKTPSKKIMIDAHTDEVGMIITGVTSEGFLKFSVVGGINPSALMCKKVMIEGKTVGVIGAKPVHLCSGEEKEIPPKAENLYIDIGASTKEEALKTVCLGDTATFISEFVLMGEKTLKAKALDDRVGCAVLISMIKNYDEYDFYATFTVQEEVGCRGARTAAFSVDPDFAICLEATTAADIAGVSDEDRVCSLGKGPAVSLMDRATVYDRSLNNAALSCQTPCQTKSAVTGGNNSGAVHLSKEGVRTIAISVPCRYIHTGSGVCNISDIENMEKLTKELCGKICSGEIK